MSWYGGYDHYVDQLAERAASIGEPPEDDQVCVDDYPEHDYEVMDERDGIRSLLCRRCGAESEEEANPGREHSDA